MDEEKKGLDAFSRLSSGKNQSQAQLCCKKCGGGMNLKIYSILLIFL